MLITQHKASGATGQGSRSEIILEARLQIAFRDGGSGVRKLEPKS